MSCLKIRLIDVDDINPKWVSEDEYAYFDLPEGIEFRETKRLTELTDVNKLKFDFVVGFTFPNTAKNHDLCIKYLSPAIIDNDYSRVPVEILVGSTVITNNDIYVKQYQGTFQIQIRLNLEHWGRNAQTLKLNTLNYEEVVIDRDHHREVIENQFKYDSSNLGIWYPLVNYGNLMRDHSLLGRQSKYINPLQFWRPWYYVTGILDKGFCALGFTFNSDLFYSEYGKSLLTYLIDKNYGISEEKVALLNAKGSITGDVYLGEDSIYSEGTSATSRYFRIPFPHAVEDASNVIDNACSIYSGNGEVNVKGNVKFKVSKDAEKVTLYYGKLDRTAGPIAGGGFSFGIKVYDTFDIDDVVENEPYEWEFESENISTTDLDKLGVFMRINNTNDDVGFPTLLLGGNIEYIGVRKYWENGEALQLNMLIDPDLVFIQAIKAISRVFNLKWFTNFGTREVLALQPYAVELYGEVIQGFFVETDVEEFYHHQDITSVKTISPELSHPRYIKISFAESTDRGIEEKEYKEELWSRTIDLGPDHSNDETLTLDNALFEPTRNSSKIHIPVILGSTEHTWDINPRIVIGRGNLLQPNVSLELRYPRWADVPTKLIPTASQFSPDLLGVFHNNDTSLLEYKKESLVFNINEEEQNVSGAISPVVAIAEDLYRLVYARWIKEKYLNLTLQYLIDIDLETFKGIDFRKYYIIKHLGTIVKCRIDVVSDYHYCSDILTPVNFIPEKQLSDLCDLVGSDVGTGDPICNNAPVVRATNLLDGCNLFTIVGFNNNVITNVLFEYRLVSGGGWITILNLTLTTAELCDIPQNYDVRATVSYEDSCPDVVTPIILVEPCPDVNFEIKCYSSINTHGGIDTNASISSNDPAITTWVTDSFEYNYNNLGFVPYDGNPLVAVGHNPLFFRATVHLLGCFTVLLFSDCTVTGTRDNAGECDDVDLQLECVPSENGQCFTFDIVGSVPYNLGDYDYFIKYRRSEDNIEWSPWLLWDAEEEVCGLYIQAKLIVHFCNDECPMYCPPRINCQSECIPFDGGTSSNLALCNDGDI